MADTENFIRSGDTTTLGAKGGAWTEIITGALTSESYLSVDSGEIEWIEAAAGSTPAITLIGNRMLEGEQQIFATVPQAIFARARISQGAVIVVTPASS